MKTANTIQNLIEVERPNPMRGLEEIKNLMHLRDNMVRRIVVIQESRKGRPFHRAA
jgi:hypothetical protein